MRTTEQKAQRLYWSDYGRLPYASNWDDLPESTRNTYYDAVANGDYELEFKEDN